MPLPSLSPEQRAAALEKAAEIRKARAELKDQLKSGKTSLAESGARDAAAVSPCTPTAGRSIPQICGHGAGRCQIADAQEQRAAGRVTYVTAPRPPHPSTPR